MSSRAFVLSVLFCLIAVSCKGPEGPVGPPGDGVASLTDPAIVPTVLATYPLDRSTGPYTDFNSRITLRFNKIMDRTSIKRAVHLSSPLGDVLLDTTSIAAQNTDAFTLAPLDARGSTYKFYWKIGISYSVTVDTSAFDINGNHLRTPYTMTFLPEPYFRVTATTPQNGATEVALGSSITIAFNSQVDTSIFRHITFQPPLRGTWGYIAAFPAPDSTDIRFTSQGALLDTLYTILIDSTAADKHGNRFPSPFSSTFTTATFRVASTTPVDGTTSYSIFKGVSIAFTAPADTASFRQAWTISPPVQGTFGWNGAFTSVTFVPAQRLADNAVYTVTLSDSLMSHTGSHLAQPYSFSFATTPFQISGTSPTDGSTNVSLTGSVLVSMTDYYDTSTVRSSVIISPAVPLSFGLVNNSPTITLHPVSGFQSNTTYIVMLSTGLHSMRGDSLAMGASFSFTTGAFAVSGTNPADGTQNVALSAEPFMTFNEAIDTSTVRAAFGIHPAVGGDLVVPSATELLFRPYNALTPNTLYTITIASSIASVSGSHLTAPYSFSFSTGGFQLTTATPAGVVDVGLKAPVSCSFNAYIDTGTVRSAFSVTPPAPGVLQFLSGAAGYTGFSFTPTAWASATRYTVVISPALQTTSGIPLSTTTTFSFTTTQFRILSATPFDGSINVPTNSTISVQVNGPIDTAGIGSVLSISPPLPGTLSAVQGATSFHYVPFQNLRTNTQYSITISSSLKTIGGGTLAAPYTFAFQTMPFQAVSSNPPDGALGISTLATVTIAFNATIDTGTVRSAFSITPPVNGVFLLTSPANYFAFTPSSAYSPLTTYTVRLSTAMRTQFGDTLLTPYSISFTTGN